MRNRFKKIMIVIFIGMLSSTLVGCNFKFLARPIVEKQNQERMEEAIKNNEITQQLTQALMKSGLEGEWVAEDNSFTIIFIDKMSYEMYVGTERNTENLREGRYVYSENSLKLFETIERNNDGTVRASVTELSVEKISENEMRITSLEDGIDIIIKKN